MLSKLKNYVVDIASPVYPYQKCYISQRYSGKITEDEKTQICSSIDCSKLSPQLLLEAVQNPIMPLRFVVRAMLIEQLKTRSTIFSAAAAVTDHTQIQPHHCDHDGHHHRDNSKQIEPIAVNTLGSLLQRDTVHRQSAHLKATMAATSSRIQSLEEELNGMKMLLHECHEKQETNILMDSGRRSSSFHFGTSENNKIVKGDKASASSASFRIITSKGSAETTGGTSNWSSSCKGTPRSTKKISERLIIGLKKAFRVSGSAKKLVKENDVYGDTGRGLEDGIAKDVMVIK